MKTEELEKYIKHTENNKTILTDSGRSVLLERFNKFVDFYDLTRKDSKNNEQKTFDGLKRTYERYDFCYERFCFSGRLPNVLLFGADTLGPDLTNHFLEMLCPKDKLYSERIKEWLKNKPHTRNLNSGDLEMLSTSGLSIEEAVYMSPPIHTNPSGLYNWGNGYMTVFYRPEFVKKVNPPLYVAPLTRDIEKILVAWPRRLRLKN